MKIEVFPDLVLALFLLVALDIKGLYRDYIVSKSISRPCEEDIKYNNCYES